MCESKATRFFRPWNVSDEKEFSDAPDMRKDTDSYVKTEEDEDSILSSTTCTADEGSTASFSENETLEMSDLNVDLTSNQNRRRRRRRSEAESRSSSVKSEESDKSNLDVLRNFVLEHGSAYPQQIQTQRELSKTSEKVSDLSYAFDKSAFEPVHPEYFQAGLHLGHFSAGQDAANCFLPSMENFNGNMAQMYYGFPMQRQFAQGLYGSVEEAVELIHRQDAAAKQLKKLRPKKFRCEHCDVAFSNNGQLKGHVRIHTGERPFKCDAENCGKSFTRNEELTRHKRIHTGLRPHSCILCGKRFGRKDHLKKHTRTHDTRDPYRVSAALGVFALGHPLQRTHPLPPYVYPI